MKTKKLYYIGERNNPQFNKPYYIAYGELTKKEAMRKEEAAYGTINLISLENLEDYQSIIEQYKNDGFTVNIR